MSRLCTFLYAAALGMASAFADDLLINEFMASNDSTLQDEDGDYSDWIEIYNSGTNAVDLNGWYLTDKTNDLTGWQFPETNLAAGKFLLVFASEKDRAVAGSELHANFKLKGTGEYLALVSTDGVTVVSEYSPQYPEQYADISYGLSADVIITQWIAPGAVCRTLVPSDGSLGTTWTARLDFDDSGWSNGTTGVGYDLTPDYKPLIGTDVSNQMYNIHPTVYIRMPFFVADASPYSAVLLKMKYDDGFVAYLNGSEIARQYSPPLPDWDSASTNWHPDEQAVVYEDFSVPDGDDYLVSGTNVLAIHGMNNGVGSSDLLFLPEFHGIGGVPFPSPDERYFQVPTPGSVNGVGIQDLGPIIRDATNAPAIPAAIDDLLVTAVITNAGNDVASATLHYRTMYSNEVSVAMLDDGLQDDGIASNGVYGVIIPSSAYATGQMVRFRIAAVDSASNTSRWPLAEDEAEYLGTVVDDPALTNQLPVFHWFIEDPDWAGPHNKTWSPASVFYLGQFYDNVQVRRRGQTAAGWPNPPYKFQFNSGHHFFYATNFPLAEEINLNSHHADKSFVRQDLAFETFRDSGGAYSETFPLRVQQNGGLYSVAVFVEQVDTRYLDRQDLPSGGALYKMYNTMTSAVYFVEKRTRKDEPNDDLQELVDGVSATNTQADRTTHVFDHVDIPSAVNYLAATHLIHNRDAYHKNYYLLRDTEGSGEWSILPWDMDLTFGRNFESGLGVLNDVITFNDLPIWTGYESWNRLTASLFESSRIRAMYVRRFRTLMDELLQEVGTAPSNLYYESRITHLVSNMSADVALHRAKWGNPYGANQDFEDGVRILTNEFIEPRRYHLYVTNHVDNGGIIPDGQTNSPTIDFGTVVFSPVSTDQDQEYIELINSNSVAVDVSGWTFSNAVSFTFNPGTVIDAGGAMYVSPDRAAFRTRTNSPMGGEDRFVVGDYSGHLSAWGETIELYDTAGSLIGSTSYPGAPSDLQRYLRITEVMYDPRDPPPGPYEDGHFEYIEFKNISSNVTFDLTDVYFGAGLTFAFTNGVTNLAAGEFLVLVRNREAFATRYDTNGIRIAGGYDGRLSNNGENLKLEDPVNETILDFRYSDTWHTNTDGGGYSLTIWDPYDNRETWGESNRWRPSAVFDGSPGWDDSDLVDADGDGMPDMWEELNFGSTNALKGGPQEDYDEDGTLNEVEYAAGTSASNGNEGFQVEIGLSNGNLVVHYYSRIAQGTGYTRKSRYYTLEETTQLLGTAWTPVAGHTNRPGLDQEVAHTNADPSAIHHFRLEATLE